MFLSLSLVCRREESGGVGVGQQEGVRRACVWWRGSNYSSSSRSGTNNNSSSSSIILGHRSPTSPPPPPLTPHALPAHGKHPSPSLLLPAVVPQSSLLLGYASDSSGRRRRRRPDPTHGPDPTRPAYNPPLSRPTRSRGKFLPRSENKRLLPTYWLVISPTPRRARIVFRGGGQGLGVGVGQGWVWVWVWNVCGGS